MRVRFRFAKLGKVRFTSHRDVARLWERALRRAELPVALTEGFSPRPKVHFGLALSTGHESHGEYLDVDLREPEARDLDLGALAGLLTPLLPEGLTVEAAAPVDPLQDSLQQAVTSCSWTIEAPGLEPCEAAVAVDRLLVRSEVIVTRQRKGRDVTDDIRPYILHLAVTGPSPEVVNPSGDRVIVAGGSMLEAEMGTQPRGLRPAELLAALESPAPEGRVRRTHQWIIFDGARTEPLSVGATSAAYAQVRAS